MRGFRISVVAVGLLVGSAYAVDKDPAFTVTVTGQAVDEQGKPVAAAKVYLANVNNSYRGDPLLATTTSNAEGMYEFRDVELPLVAARSNRLEKSIAAAFEVFGAAKGFGFTWTGACSLRPGPRPAAAKAESGPSFYEGERLETQLMFRPEAKIHGRITDDAGRPLEGAQIMVGVVKPQRGTYPSGYCKLLTNEVDAPSAVTDTFAAVRLLPDAPAARTDADGKYEISGLPREAVLIALLMHDEVSEEKRFNIVTSERAQEQAKSLGIDGVLDESLQVPRQVQVRAVLAGSAQAASNITIRVRSERMMRAGNSGRTDADGNLFLKLLPGEYVLIGEPSYGAAYLKTELPIKVAEAPPQQKIEFTLEQGAIVELLAVEEKTARGVSGVEFSMGNETTPDRQRLQSQSVFVDNPATGQDGRLRAIVAPADRQFFISKVPRSYEAIRKTSEPVQLKPGETSRVEFLLRPIAEQPVVAGIPANETNPVLQSLEEKWRRQIKLMQSGRATVQIHIGGASMSKTKLAELLAGLSPNEVPDIRQAINSTLPEAHFEFGAAELSSDGDKHRSDSKNPSNSEVWHTNVRNGEQGIDYQVDNSQVSIYNLARFRYGTSSLRDLYYVPFRARVFPQAEPVIERDGPMLTIKSSLEQSTSVVRVNAATGFVYCDSTYDGKRASGRQTWQFAPQVQPNGAVVPGLILSFNHRGDDVISLNVFRPISLELDVEHAPDAFVLSVPAGTNVFDFRGGDVNEPTCHTAREPLRDVVAFANSFPADAGYLRTKPPVGSIAPAISAETWLSSTGVATAPELVGKIVLVNFWGIGCGPCVAELPEVQAIADDYKDDGVVVVGLHYAGETVEAVSKLAAKKKLTYPLAIDKEKDGVGETFAHFGVWGIPAGAVIDAENRIAYVGRWGDAVKQLELLLKKKRESAAD